MKYPEFLDIITIALKNYKEKVNEKRSMIMDHSLLEMSSFILDSKKLKSLETLLKKNMVNYKTIHDTTKITKKEFSVLAEQESVRGN